ncbi:MAG: alpha-L-fucosidase [Candidatus Sumerlaeota bacterium]|nr:alpha-L-fucosidase [Candidatus Sumerlaeota bacterium]
MTDTNQKINCTRRRFITAAIPATLVGTFGWSVLALENISGQTSRTGKRHDIHDKKEIPPMPTYLKGYENLYRQSPHAAAIQWFRDARYGLMMHFGVYSIEGFDARYQAGRTLKPWWDFDPISVKEYEKLMDRFTIENFSADKIADIAVEAGMKYITITAKHCDGFCLWDSPSEPFNSMNSAARIDILAELARACRERSLGFFPFWEVGYDTRHPDSPPQGRIDFDRVGAPRDPSLHWGNDIDVSRYVDHMFVQIRELMKYDIAGVWLDGYGVTKDKADLFRFQELYDMVREAKPFALMINKAGPTGTEDVCSAESDPQAPGMDPNYDRNMAQGKPLEICKSMGPGWGWEAPEHRVHGPDQPGAWPASRLWEELKKYNTFGVNLLLNCGPRGDGTLDPEQVEVLLEIGERIRKQGMPKASGAEKAKLIGEMDRHFGASILRKIHAKEFGRLQAEKNRFAGKTDAESKAKYGELMAQMESLTSMDDPSNRRQVEEWKEAHDTAWFNEFMKAEGRWGSS